MRVLLANQLAGARLDSSRVATDTAGPLGSINEPTTLDAGIQISRILM
jgi:hypothetical protein